MLNPVLAAGEPGYNKNTGAFKIGDGVTPWNDLEYFVDCAEIQQIIEDNATVWVEIQTNTDGTYTSNLTIEEIYEAYQNNRDVKCRFDGLQLFMPIYIYKNMAQFVRVSGYQIDIIAITANGVVYTAHNRSIDQKYNENSTNAQSGKAVAQAVAEAKLDSNAIYIPFYPDSENKCEYTYDDIVKMYEDNKAIYCVSENGNTYSLATVNKEYVCFSVDTVGLFQSIIFFKSGNISSGNYRTKPQHTYSASSEYPISGKGVSAAVTSAIHTARDETYELINYRIKPIEFFVTDKTNEQGNAMYACSTHTYSDLYQKAQDNFTFYYGVFYDGCLEYAYPMEVDGALITFGKVFTMVNIDGVEYWTDSKSEFNYFNKRIDDVQTTIDVVDDQLAEFKETAQADILELQEHSTYTNLYGRVEITEDDIAAAGDEGITVVSIGSEDVDLSLYNDILFKICVPVSDTLNSANGKIALTGTADNNAVFTGDFCWLLKPNSSSIATVCYFHNNRTGSFSIRTEWTGDNFHYGLVVKNGYATSFGYGGATNGWTQSVLKKNSVRFFHLAANIENTCDFKFPVGTWVEVWGR